LYLERKAKELENQREINLKMRNNTIMSLLQKKDLKLKQSLDENRILKEQRVENENLLKNFKIEEQNYKAKRAEEIKFQILNGKDKKREIEVIYLYIIFSLRRN
jgi:hypothetical protein